MTCPRCNDTGLIEYTGGTHWTYGDTVTGSHRVEATPEKPIYKRCPCRKDAPKPEAPAGRSYE